MVENENTELDLSTITDEQLAQQFPGQDVAALRASLDRADGKTVHVSPNADGDTDGSNNDATSNQDDAGSVEYPDWIPDKYRNGTVDEAMQALAKGHKELEAHMGQSSDDEGEKGEADDDTDSDDTDDKSTSHFRLGDLESEFVENGTLSPETYAAAEKDGWTKGEVDSYIAGQQALAQQLITRVHNSVGGEQAYTDMMAWAQGNLSEAQVNAYDEALMGTNQNSVDLAVAGLKSMYEAKVGKQPNLQTGDGDKQSGNVAPFASAKEMTAAMADPRYSTDPAYRAQVARRLEHVTFW